MAESVNGNDIMIEIDVGSTMNMSGIEVLSREDCCSKYIIE